MRALACALMLVASPCTAAPLTLTFGGTITEIVGDMATLAPDVTPGTDFVGTIDFTTESDRAPGLFTGATVTYVIGTHWVQALLPALVGPSTLTGALLMYGEHSNIGPMNAVSLHLTSLDPYDGEMSFSVAKGFTGGSSGGAIGRIHPLPEPETHTLAVLGIIATLAPYQWMRIRVRRVIHRPGIGR